MNPSWVAMPLAIGLALLLLKSKNVTGSGAIAGGVLVFLYSLSSSLAPLLTFGAFVVIGLASSRLGKEKKVALGLYQNAEKPRSWVHAFANCGVGASLVLIGWLWPEFLHPEGVSLLACGSLAAVCADTCSSEWGTWLGGTPRSIVGFRQVPIGTDGAVTFAGTFAGILGALIITLIAMLGAGDSANLYWVILLAGIVGNLVDSIVGATLEPHFGPQGGSVVNTICALTGALTTLLLAG